MKSIRIHVQNYAEDSFRLESKQKKGVELGGSWLGEHLSLSCVHSYFKSCA